jgi:hypothetical protein|tara:strand:- start:778 stop:933 length:156 start_codon:yes stop_codon:yes gene_type:complete
MMQRVLFVFAMMLCVAAAFVQPGVLKSAPAKLDHCLGSPLPGASICFATQH